MATTLNNPINTVSQLHRIPEVVCASERDVVHRLYEDELKNNLTQYLYRGQRGRFLRPYPPSPRDGYSKYEITIESVVPNDYRGVEDLIAGVQANPPDNAYTDEGVLIRLYLSLRAVTRNIEKFGDQSAINWFNSFVSKSTIELTDAVGSIGQHYSVRTQFLDVTTEKRVALWMATFDFYPPFNYLGATAPENPCVIYRFDLQALADAMNTVNARNNWQGRDACRIADIRGIPATVAGRPAAQHGLSLIGMEKEVLLKEAILRNAIVAFTFPTDASPSAINTLTGQDIQPPVDTMPDSFAYFSSPDMLKNPSDVAIQAWLDKHVNPFNNPNIQFKVGDWWTQLINHFMSAPYAGWNG